MTHRVETLRIGPAPFIAVDLAGDRDAPLLVFLHGIGGNRSNWRHQLPVFSRWFRAAAWDARGYGHSDDHAGPFAFPDFASDLARVVTALGTGPAHMVGLSMGARIALEFQARHPGLTASLTLADTSAGSAEINSPEKIEAFLDARRKPLLEGRTPADLAPDLARVITGPNAGPDVRAEIIASLAALRPGPYIRTLEAATRHQTFPPLDGIRVPTLVIVGSEDRIAPPETARTMAAAIPDARFAVIEGAGHISNLEAPDEFNRILAAFLAEITGIEGIAA